MRPMGLWYIQAQQNNVGMFCLPFKHAIRSSICAVPCSTFTLAPALQLLPPLLFVPHVHRQCLEETTSFCLRSSRWFHPSLDIQITSLLHTLFRSSRPRSIRSARNLGPPRWRSSARIGPHALPCRIRPRVHPAVSCARRRASTDVDGRGKLLRSSDDVG